MATSNSVPDSWTETGLLDELESIDQGHHHHKICFILGAGASVTSGVPTGGQFVDEWLRTARQRETDGKGDFETWATNWAAKAQNPIKNFDPKSPAKFYPQIFERVYAGRYPKAYEFLDAKMKDARPGIGYVLLAQILEFSRHKTIITTNFDNLIAEALYFYSNTRPLICGHESLAVFATADPVRPLVAKIHRDLYLNPINDSEGTSKLNESWTKALREIFRTHTPVVIGYGGNDGSLMGFLDNLSLGELHNGIYWCHRPGETLREEIIKVVAKHNGKTVAIEGFDQFVLKLYGRLCKGWKADQKRDLEGFIRNRADEQTRRYKEDFDKFGAKTVNMENQSKQPSSETVTALNNVAPQKNQTVSWWQWVVKANAEKDSSKRDAIFREAVKKLPESSPLLGTYALFLKDELKKYDEAQEFFERSIKAEPNNVAHLGNYANFLRDICREYDRAQEYYERALKADPNHANNLGNYANFLSDIRKEYDRAQEYYEQALKVDPNDDVHLGSYAGFLQHVRKNNNRAQEYYERALKAAPDDVYHLTNYAGFLLSQGQLEKGGQMLERAIKLTRSGSTLDLVVEAWFYAFVHWPADKRAGALIKLRELILKKTARSPYWDFSKNIKQAIKAGHPDAKWLPKLADVINGKAEPAILQDWPAWRDAA